MQPTQELDFKVRFAIKLDLLRLIQLGEEYFQEISRWSSFSYNHEKVMKSAMAAIDHADHTIFLAYDEKDNNILGFMWGCITSQVWSDDRVGHDVFIYVRPQARGMEIGKALIKEFLWWCETRGCKGVQCGANSGIQDDAPAINMYRSLGFGPGGRCFNLQFKGE